MKTEDNVASHEAASPASAVGGKNPKRKRAAKRAAGPKKQAKARNGALLRSVAGRTYDISKYDRVKTPKGSVSFDCGDAIAKKYRGADLSDLYDAVAKRKDVSVRSLKEKYGKLNIGMQRMTLGNILRAAA